MTVVQPMGNSINEGAVASPSAVAISESKKSPAMAPLDHNRPRIVPETSGAAFPHPLSPNQSSGSESDLAAATTLRRLYFKAGRNYKPKGTVPTDKFMGTSTASEVTINTSTESASTLVTNVTSNTDTDATNDSFDFGDHSGQSEPLLSSLDEPASNSISSMVSPLILRPRINDQEILIERPCTVYYQKRPLKAQYEESYSISDDDDLIEISGLQKSESGKAGKIHQQSWQSTLRSSETSPAKYTFEKGSSGKHAAASSSSSSSPSSVSTNTMMVISPPPSVTDEKILTRKDQRFVSSNGSNLNPVIFRDKVTFKKRINSAPPITSSTGQDKLIDNTMFPFDREAIDYQRIHSECFAVKETVENELRFPFLGQETDPDSPISDKPDSILKTTLKSVSNTEVYEFNEVKDQNNHGSTKNKGPDDIFRQYAILSQQEKHKSIDKNRIRRSSHVEKRKIWNSQSDAFTPQAAKIQPSLAKEEQATEDNNLPASPKSKFDQINRKFEQILPNQKRISNCFTSIENIPKSTKALSPAATHKHCTGDPLSKLRNLRVTPPDLRVDYLNSPQESDEDDRSNSNQNWKKVNSPDRNAITLNSSYPHSHHRHGTVLRNSSEEEGSDCEDDLMNTRLIEGLDSCQKNAHHLRSINVTPNPMDVPVCTQQPPPRATIVVQQASLSLDHSVETLLLRSEGDFISVENLGKDQDQENCAGSFGISIVQKTKKDREDNMRHLLDVTNKFTNEEIRDFEMRYCSPHHRSQSVKSPRGSGRPNQLCLPQQRSRVASMPNTGVEEEYYRLRHFSITGKGVVNRGDSLKSRRTRSNTSVASSNSSNEQLASTVVVGNGNSSGGMVGVGFPRTSATCSLASSRESSTSNPGSFSYRVLMLGASAVGKSSLVSQFMTSEYLHAYDTSIDDESGEKTVSVLLSGEESDLIFIDHSATEMPLDKCLSTYDPQGYCVIYSSADRGSFNLAERMLQGLWTTENIAQKAVILVANKADLARSRVVTSEDGKAMATAYDCKFIETSVGINHNVDELLVGLLSQIRLKLENPEKSRDLFRKRSFRKSKRRACSPLSGAASACGGNEGNSSSPVTNMPQLADVPISGSAQSSPRKYRGSKTSASLKVKGLLGRVWTRDSKSKSCENLHAL